MAATLKALHSQYKAELSGTYPAEEAESLVYWLMEAYLGVKKRDLLSQKVVESIPSAMEQALEKLKSGLPIQYILGKAPFYGREFLVSPEVLIPRQETEELVHLILKNHSGKKQVLDLGTGSGCIAISLALEWNEASVTALDISGEALAIAQKNASDLGATVDFVKADMLSDSLPVGEVDILVSNPPYVTEQEKTFMRPNVLEHEPHLALFVPDTDPLLYYKSLVRHAGSHLVKGGFLYVEVNEKFGPEVASLMEANDLKEVRVYRDLQGKDRIVWGRGS
ncbi:peptide chain release factor N(5)-glutamine methyltransferase [Cyclobacterium jeungdonense]|uniref:Release factor glutamine methyltransferase n=1 Tax=Cyclobacterium jeungdonense TaxID=708087 RepID=A0ABT8CCF8_9BACT|nr:peptide chain release factor N(5)-glutamine methyltransferase [Cyclobacterium jeungdonense]MDN3689639.1 peptide chain release factor N(5)-glutamine methyltransferase [Cyclobacterium jeungdonense]